MNEAYMEVLAQYRKLLKAYARGAKVSISEAAELIRPRLVKIFEEKLKEQEQILSVPAPKRRKRR